MIKPVEMTALMVLVAAWPGATAHARADYFEVSGDTPCSAGYALVSLEEARAQADEICSHLGTWDIVRLAGGGSMDGPGYNCKIRGSDTRELGNTLCRKIDSFVKAEGDNHDECPASSQPASYEVTKQSTGLACSALEEWDIARLADGGSIDGPGYNCKVRRSDDRDLGDKLCVRFDFENARGDQPCPSGSRFATTDEARDGGRDLCAQLGEWDIVRLADGGSLDGPGYGCNVREDDDRQLGDSLCKQD